MNKRTIRALAVASALSLGPLGIVVATPAHSQTQMERLIESCESLTAETIGKVFSTARQYDRLFHEYRISRDDFVADPVGSISHLEPRQMVDFASAGGAIGDELERVRLQEFPVMLGCIEKVFTGIGDS